MHQPTIPAPRPLTHMPRLTPVPGACDTHIHMFEASDGPEYVIDPAYRAPRASLDIYRQLATPLGIDRAVLVQPSVYGSDHGVMLRALARSPERLRGIAVVDVDVPQMELKRMHALGVRGIRLNLVSENQVVGWDGIPHLEKKIAPLGWHLQLYVDLMKTRQVHERLRDRRVNCVIDHFGRIDLDSDDNGLARRDLLALARLPHVWFKLSGSYRLTRSAFPFDNAGALAREIHAAAPDRCVWGSDWPHTMCRDMPEDGELMDALRCWFPRREDQVAILATNAARLYCF